MSRKTVYEALESTGIPVAHMAFPKGKAPALPWMVYIQGASSDLYADGENYARINEYTVELYQMPTSEEVEKTLEAALATLGAWSRDEEIWIESENVIETVYRFTVLEKE